MRWPLREEELPRGYRLSRGRAGVLAFDANAESLLHSGGFGPEGGERLSESEFTGRRPLGVITSAGPPRERLVVRSFHHGGFFRWLGPFFYLDPRRPFHELSLADELERLGIRTPRVVAARARRSSAGAAFGWQLDLVTRAVEGCMDGAQALERLRRGELSCAQRQLLFRSAGTLIGRLHRVGFLHHDLHPRNLLFGAALEEEGDTWVLDLDRSSFVRGGLSEGLRWDNLGRMWRWLRRKEKRVGLLLSRADLGRFLRAYEREVGEREGWKRVWRGVWRRGQRVRLFHQAGWLLEGCLGIGHERHDGRE